MSETTATTVTPAVPGGETAPVIPASVVAPVAPETAPAVTPSETPVAPLAEASVTPEPAAAGAAPDDASREAQPPVEAPVPEQAAAPVYTDFTFPEGVRADAELVTRAAEVFGKHGLSQEAAQELVDLHNEIAPKMLAAYQEEATGYWAKKSADWVKELRDDPQVGGNRFQTSTDLARAALSDGLPTADRDRLWADLTDTKMGDHPVLFKRMAQLGRERQQVLQLTGSTTWAEAMKKLREPAPGPAGNPTRPNNTARPADRRYQQRTN